MSQTPPPLPPQYLAPPPATPPRPTFYQQAARASYIAPLVAFALGCLTMSERDHNRTLAFVIGFTNLGLIALGLGFAVIALVGYFRSPQGKRATNVLSGAVAGLVINLVLLAITASTFLLLNRLAKQRAAASANAAARDAADEQAGRDAFEKHPGWFGAARVGGGGVITFATLRDDPQITRFYLPSVSQRFSLAVISVDNSAGAGDLSVDTTHLRLFFAGGATADALPLRPLLNGLPSPDDRREAARMFTPPFQVPTGEKLLGRPVFLPPGLDFTTLQQVTMELNGHPFTLPGRYMSAEEKADLVRRGEEAQRAKDGGSE